jgi:glycosyltransferase involved in cell wall biosynthesis
MRAALANASAVVMNTREAARRLVERFPEMEAVPVVAITNGFDADDFADPAPARDDTAFGIVHTGAFLSELGARHRRTRVTRRLLGGAHPGLDIMTRSPAFLLDALDRVIAARPELAGTIELHLAGALSGYDRTLLSDRQVTIREHGYLTHADSVAMIRSADLLFLPMHAPPPGVRSASMPGKTFEYLAAGRPILAAVPDGDARDILTRAGGGLLARPADVAQMAGLITEEVDRWLAGRPTPPPNPEVVAEFERRHLTQRLAAVFDAVLAGSAGHERNSGSPSTG